MYKQIKVFNEEKGYEKIMNEFHQEVNKAIESKEQLFHRITIDSIIDKARSYRFFMQMVKLSTVFSLIVTFRNLWFDLDATFPIISTTLLMVVNSLFPSYTFYAENLVIKNKDIVDTDKLDAVREVKCELKDR